MNREEKKEKKDKSGFSITGCCSENFKGMSEMMRNCCEGPGDSDGSNMMKAIMEMCFMSKAGNTKGDAEPPNEPNDKVKSL